MFLWLGSILATAALGWFAPRAGDRWLRPLEQRAALAHRKALTIVLLGLAAMLLRLALLPVLPVPLPSVHDEFSYLLAADTFAQGRLANPPHPMWQFFETFHVLQHPTYASKYPPGPGGALALGQLLGHPWIGVLLSLAAMVMAMTWMLQGWVPPAWALLGGVLVLLRLGLANPWFDNYYDASLAAAGGALVLGAAPRILRSRRTRDALILGGGAVVLACTRPFEGFLFCLPIAVAITISLVRQPKLQTAVALRALAPAALVMAAGFAFLGYYNARVTGSALQLPWVLYQHQYFNYPIFAWQKPGPRLVYSNPQFEEFFNRVQRAYYSATWRAWKQHMSRTFWNWWYVFPGLLLTVPFLMLARVLRDRRMRLPLLVCAVCAFGLLSVVWFQPSYAAPLAAAFFLLVVQALRHLRHASIHGRPLGIFATRLLVFLAIDWVVIQAGHAARYPLRGWNTRRAAVSRTLAALPGQHLVLVRYGPSHNVHQEWVYNAADIDHSKIVWAREIPGVDLRPLLAYFRNREVWLLQPDASPARLEPYPQPSGP